MLVATIFTMFYWGDWRVALVVLGCLPVTGPNINPNPNPNLARASSGC